MDNQHTANDEAIVKKMRWEIIVIGILLAIIAAGLIFYFSQDKPGEHKADITRDKRFKGPIPDHVADGGRRNYENIVRPTAISISRGIIFDTATIRRYITDTIPLIIARHTANMQAQGTVLTADMEWRVSFYWMSKLEGHQVKLGFYAIPVLVRVDRGEIVEVFDYFEGGNRIYYNRPADTDPKNIHDEGHLWP